MWQPSHSWAQSNIMDGGAVFKEGYMFFMPLYPCKEVDMEWGLDTRHMDTWYVDYAMLYESRGAWGVLCDKYPSTPGPIHCSSQTPEWDFGLQ